MAAAEPPCVAREYQLGIDVSGVVNVEIDFDQDEAREILGFMDKYHIPTYGDAVRLLAMVGAGASVADPEGRLMRTTLRVLIPAVCVVAGMAFDHDFGW